MARRSRSASERSGKRRRKAPLRLKAFWLVVAAIAALTVFAVLRKTVRPILLCHRERTEVIRLENQLADLRRENRALETRRRYLESPAGAETEARKLGYVRPGEVSVIIQDEETSDRKD